MSSKRQETKHRISQYIRENHVLELSGLELSRFYCVSVERMAEQKRLQEEENADTGVGGWWDMVNEQYKRLCREAIPKSKVKVRSPPLLAPCYRQ